MVRRLATPTGLVLAGLCLFLPFVTGACTAEQQRSLPPEDRQQWRVSYAGVDIVVGGQPDIAYAGRESHGELRRLDQAGVVRLLGQRPTKLRPQPLAWLALALIAAGLVAVSLRRSRWRAAVTAAATLIAALALYGATLLAWRQAVDMTADVLALATRDGPPATPTEGPPPEVYTFVRDRFHFDSGFWLTSGLLLTIGMTNVVMAVPGRIRTRARSASADSPSSA